MPNKILDDFNIDQQPHFRWNIPKKRLRFWAVYIVASVLFVASRDYDRVYEVLASNEETYILGWHALTFMGVPLLPIWGEDWSPFPERQRNLGAILGVGSCVIGMVGVFSTFLFMHFLLENGFDLQVSYFILVTFPYITLSTDSK